MRRRLPYAAAAGGAAVSRIHRKQRSFLLPLLTAQPMQTAQRRKWGSRSKLRSCLILLLVAQPS